MASDPNNPFPMKIQVEHIALEGPTGRIFTDDSRSKTLSMFDVGPSMVGGHHFLLASRDMVGAGEGGKGPPGRSGGRSVRSKSCRLVRRKSCRLVRSHFHFHGPVELVELVGPVGAVGTAGPVGAVGTAGAVGAVGTAGAVGAVEPLCPLGPLGLRWA